MAKLVLIDGNAILHRAFHALPPLTSKNGELVNAVYGFFSMFLKILEDLIPQYVTVCFDRKAPTFRKQLYVGYQAKRPKMADELVPQIAKVHEILEKAKISIFEIDGYEADDLIGTLARQAARINTNKYQSQMSNKKNKDIGSLEIGNLTLEIIIVSGDRDMLQLVNSHVKVLAPITGITKLILFDEEKVEEKYGIKASQIVDYKALVGDSSDNYPGVKGIGPKTAASLLREYGSFENMYKNINSLPTKISEKLALDAEQASLAKKLATIVTDAPITLYIEKCSIEHFATKALCREFERIGFRSLIKRLIQDNRQNQDGKIKEAQKNKEQIEQLGLL